MRGTPKTCKSYVARGRVKQAVCRAKRAEAVGGLAVHTQGGAYTKWCTHKAVQTQGGLWPPQESCYLRTGVWAGPCVERSEPKQWEVWRSTHKAVHTQSGAHTRRSVATAGVLLFEDGCVGWPLRRAKRAEAVGGLAVHTQGGAYTKWCTHKAVCGHRKSLVI